VAEKYFANRTIVNSAADHVSASIAQTRQQKLHNKTAHNSQIKGRCRCDI